jgi:hypothetical protein
MDARSVARLILSSAAALALVYLAVSGSGQEEGARPEVPEVWGGPVDIGGGFGSLVTPPGWQDLELGVGGVTDGSGVFSDLHVSMTRAMTGYEFRRSSGAPVLDGASATPVQLSGGRDATRYESKFVVWIQWEEGGHVVTVSALDEPYTRYVERLAEAVRFDPSRVDDVIDREPDVPGVQLPVDFGTVLSD